MPHNTQDAPQSATSGRPCVSIHSTTFARNTVTGLWRGVCTCGWFKMGTREEVQSRAATHDTEWVAEPIEQPAPVAP